MAAQPEIVDNNSTARSWTARRTWYAVAGLFCLTFTLFEVTKHGQPTVTCAVLALLFVGGPDIAHLVARRRSARVRPPTAGTFYRITHRTALPWVILLYYTFAPVSVSSTPWKYLLPETNVETAPGFTVGLVWMTYLCLERMLGRRA